LSDDVTLSMPADVAAPLRHVRILYADGTPYFAADIAGFACFAAAAIASRRARLIIFSADILLLRRSCRYTMPTRPPPFLRRARHAVFSPPRR